MLGNNGVPMVAVMLIPQSGSNQIAIADAFYARLEQIKKDLPDDITFTVAMDATRNIRTTITK